MLLMQWRPGAGSVYGYDAIGSFERGPYCVQGSGSALATSILDNQVSIVDSAHLVLTY